MLSFLFSVSILHAQISKGSLFLGGNINFYSSDNSADDNSIGYKQDVFTVSSVIGKVIKNNLVLGAGLGYSHTKYRQGPTNIPNDQKSNGYSGNVFLRKYMGLGKNFYIYLESALGARYDKSDNSPINLNNNYKTISVSLGVTPGISYAISKKLQIETGFNQLLSIGYSHEKGNKNPSYSVPYKTNTFSVSTGFNNSYFSSIFFGFKLFLG